ncbi:hypothetical protein AAH446_01405 [Erwinia sp. P6884]|uniref:hypothetical protein n=1 Tax=Erwinia sp. P6884 TaxID=3141450 RepID=UPI003198BC7D
MFNHPLFGVRLAFIVSLATFVLWCVAPTEALIHVMEEGQLVETLTLYLYAVTLLYFIFRPNLPIALLTRCSIILALFAMLAREADLHKVIDNMSLLKLRFWTGDLPLSDKLLALMIMLPIVAACLYLLKKHAKNVWVQAKRRKAYAVTTMTFIILIPLTNIADRSLGLLKESFGWHAPLWLVALQTSQEELLEMSLPVLALVAAWQFRRDRNAKGVEQTHN